MRQFYTHRGGRVPAAGILRRAMAENKLLRIFLNDHLATSAAAAALARRSLRKNRGSELGRVLEELAAELEDDLGHLEETIRSYGLKPSAAKKAAGAFAERLGRLKLNGRIVSYSPLSRLAEIEGLSLLLARSAACWRTLGAIGLEGAAPLAERAERRIQELVPHRDAAARLALGSEDVQ
ncbi:MAG TPA: hypothetical protein VH306_08430 [Gaiellaceae bacterium]|jgi:hypothetical protein